MEAYIWPEHLDWGKPNIQSSCVTWKSPITRHRQVCLSISLSQADRLLSATVLQLSTFGQNSIELYWKSRLQSHFHLFFFLTRKVSLFYYQQSLTVWARYFSLHRIDQLQCIWKACKHLIHLHNTKSDILFWNKLYKAFYVTFVHWT